MRRMGRARRWRGALPAWLALVAFLLCQFSAFANGSGWAGDGMAPSCHGMEMMSVDSAAHHSAAGHLDQSVPLAKTVKVGCACFCAVIPPSAPLVGGVERGIVAAVPGETGESLLLAPPSRPPRIL